MITVNPALEVLLAPAFPTCANCGEIAAQVSINGDGTIRGYYCPSCGHVSGKLPGKIPRHGKFGKAKSGG